MLRRLFQLILCVAAITAGVWVGEWVSPTPGPAPPPTPAPASSSPDVLATPSAHPGDLAPPRAAPSGAPVSRRPGRFRPATPLAQAPSPRLVIEDHGSGAVLHPDPAAEASYAAIDLRARSAPPDAAASIRTLARWLVQGARSDREKARALFVWITENIAYKAGIDPLHPPFETAEDTLRERIAVCGGYARLFKEMAAEVGLKAELVSGYARTSVRLRQVGGRPYGVADGHAWNAVEVDGGWQLLDCTWGAGGLEDGRFEKHFQPFFFLTPPRLFAYTHFPKQSRWQLLAAPLSLEAHRALPLVTAQAWALGLTFSAGGTVEAPEGTARVTFSSPQDVRIKAVLKPLSAPHASGEDSIPGTVLQQQRGTQCETEVAAPSEGPFRLDIFAGSASEESKRLDLAASFVIRSGKAAETPLVSGQGSSLPRGAYLSPSRRDLQAGTTQRFEVHVPYSKGIFVRTGSRREPLSGEWPSYAGDVLLDAGTVSVCAEVGEDRYVVLAEYEAR